jgi:hypothetical protein
MEEGWSSPTINNSMARACPGRPGEAIVDKVCARREHDDRISEKEE